jgi:DNA-binding transcriptional LysR family regulator
MALDWNDLRYLLAVRRRGTRAAAAKELKVTKGTVSRRLGALEESLGVAVVERQPGGFVLTREGKEAAATGEHVERLCEDLEERVNGARTDRAVGLVRLTAPSWLADRLVLPALPELRAREPELEIELLGTSRILDLVKREADIAIRNVVPEQQSLVSQRVAILGGCVYASPLYLERRGIPKDVEDVRQHDVVAYESFGGIPGFEWLQGPERGGRIVFRADDPAALASAASAGFGLAAIPCLIGDTEPGLVRVPSLGFATTPLYCGSSRSCSSKREDRHDEEHLGVVRHGVCRHHRDAAHRKRSGLRAHPHRVAGCAVGFGGCQVAGRRGGRHRVPGHDRDLRLLRRVRREV